MVRSGMDAARSDPGRHGHLPDASDLFQRDRLPRHRERVCGDVPFAPVRRIRRSVPPFDPVPERAALAVVYAGGDEPGRGDVRRVVRVLRRDDPVRVSPAEAVPA